MEKKAKASENVKLNLRHFVFNFFSILIIYYVLSTAVAVMMGRPLDCLLFIFLFILPIHMDTDTYTTFYSSSIYILWNLFLFLQRELAVCVCVLFIHNILPYILFLYIFFLYLFGVSLHIFVCLSFPFMNGICLLFSVVITGQWCCFSFFFQYLFFVFCDCISVVSIARMGACLYIAIAVSVCVW